MNIEANSIEEFNNYSVYARINKNKQVEKIFSTCFEHPLKEDILIKSGRGDEFIHVSYYIIYDYNMCHNYKVEDKELLECTEEEKQLEYEEMQKNIPLTETQVLQRQLADLEIELLK